MTTKKRCHHRKFAWSTQLWKIQRIDFGSDFPGILADLRSTQKRHFDARRFMTVCLDCDELRRH